MIVLSNILVFPVHLFDAFLCISYLVNCKILKSLQLTNDHLNIGNLKKKKTLIWGHHMM